MSLIIKPLFIVTLAIGLAAGIPAQAEQAAAPTTTTDPGIPLEELDIIAAPMMVDELKTEADSWQALLKKAAENVAETKLRIKRAAEEKVASEEEAEQSEEQGRKSKAAGDEATAQRHDVKKGNAMDELTALRAERTALIDRLDIILQRINQKIGLDENGKEKEDVAVYRRYISAVGGIKLDVTDAESVKTSIKGWLYSKDGGLRWAINISTFLGILVAFWVLSSLLGHATRKALRVGGSDSALLEKFLVGMVRRIVIMVGIIVAVSALEVNIGPLLALVGAAGFVVAFALQDTLGNFASGIMLMLYRPFDVDDVIDVAGVSGKVKSMNLVATTITTHDNKLMAVPNNKIWGDIITNVTGSATRRVDLVFGIAYDDDIDHAKQVLEDIVAKHPKVLKNPATVIELHELADSSVNFICRPWANTEDYWAVYWDVTRSVKARFDAEGLSFPFPQRDVHVYQLADAPPEKASQPGQTDNHTGADKSGLDED